MRRAHAVAFVLALALDAAFGDPPDVAHPVAWFGRLARGVEALAPREAARRRAGAAATWSLLAFAALAAARLARTRPRLVAEGVLLWLACSRRTLLARAEEVAAALEREDLAGARWTLGRHLVSRDASDLDAGEVAGAAIESVAENLSDGVVAPWCWYATAGAPGAWAYRALNTLDAMWGYRTPRYLEFGRTAARLDDAANFVPARLTALAVIAASTPAGGSSPGAWRAWRRDAGATSSPNAGQPMAAMAGALGVVLEKRGEYRLDAGGRAPGPADVRRAVGIARLASTGVAALMVALVPRGAR